MFVIKLSGIQNIQRYTEKSNSLLKEYSNITPFISSESSFLWRMYFLQCPLLKTKTKLSLRTYVKVVIKSENLQPLQNIKVVLFVSIMLVSKLNHIWMCYTKNLDKMALFDFTFEVSKKSKLLKKIGDLLWPLMTAEVALYLIKHLLLHNVIIQFIEIFSGIGIFFWISRRTYVLDKY